MTQTTAEAAAVRVQTVELASLEERFVAAVVDGVLFAILAIVGVKLVGPWLPPAGTMRFRAAQQLALMTVTLPLLLFQWRQIARIGQSIGKRWQRTRIVRVDGTSVSWSTGVALREWLIHGIWIGLYVVVGRNVIADWLGIGIYLPIFFGNRRCLHDFIAGTKVVRVG